MQENLISIILPVYNAEEYISEAIESLINQTYQNIQIICVNDGSTDSSSSIIHKYASQDKRIVVIEQENLGVAVARNKGLELAIGSYIMFCDSDDFLELDMCKKMLDAIVSTNVGIAVCSAHVFASSNINRNISFIQRKFDFKTSGIFSLDDYTFLSSLGNELWNKIFKTEIIRKYNIKFPENIWCDDRAFVMKYLSCAQNAYILKDKLYQYRLTPNSYCENVQNNKFKKFFDTVYAMQDVKNFYVKNKLLEKYKYYFAEKVAFSFDFYYKTCDRYNQKDFISSHKQLLNDIFLEEDFLGKNFKIYLLKKKKVSSIVKILNNEKGCVCLSKIFSVKNKDIYKTITICGLKVKLKNKKLIEKQKQIKLNERIIDLSM